MTRKAKELQLEHAEAMCVDHCRRRVSVHNAVDWFVQAHVHGGTLVGSTRQLWCLIMSHLFPAQLTVSQRGTFTGQLCKLDSCVSCGALTRTLVSLHSAMYLNMGLTLASCGV